MKNKAKVYKNKQIKVYKNKLKLIIQINQFKKNFNCHFQLSYKMQHKKIHIIIFFKNIMN